MQTQLEQQLEPLGTTIIRLANRPIHWFRRRLYFNGHNVSKGYGDLACVPRAFQNAAHMVGVDVSPTDLRNIANKQRGFTAKQGMNTLDFANEFDNMRAEFEVLGLLYYKDKHIDLDKAVALLEVNDCTVGVFALRYPRHALAIQVLEGEPIVIIDNNAFTNFQRGWRGEGIHTVIGLRLKETNNVC